MAPRALGPDALPEFAMRTAVPLTSLSHGAGCGCKLAAASIGPIVRGLPRSADPRLLDGSLLVVAGVVLFLTEVRPL
jgi:hypothetical protein